jgi:hypothetical protein
MVVSIRDIFIGAARVIERKKKPSHEWPLHNRRGSDLLNKSFFRDSNAVEQSHTFDKIDDIRQLCCGRLAILFIESQ